MDERQAFIAGLKYADQLVGEQEGVSVFWPHTDEIYDAAYEGWLKGRVESDV